MKYDVNFWPKAKKTQRDEIALPDPIDWSDPGRRVACDPAGGEPIPYQTAAMDSQWFWNLTSLIELIGT